MRAELMATIGSFPMDVKPAIRAYNYLNTPVIMEWAEKHSIKILPQMSSLEWHFVMEDNPFYLMFAFDVKYDLVVEFARVTQLSIPDPIHAHAILMGALRNTPQVTTRAVNNMCRKNGVATVPENIATVVPFNLTAMRGHPFERVDLDQTTVANLMAMLNYKVNMLSAIREKRHTLNYVILDEEKMVYMLKTNDMACFRRIAAMILEDKKGARG